jgi:hypothetical protein
VFKQNNPMELITPSINVQAQKNNLENNDSIYD